MYCRSAKAASGLTGVSPVLLLAAVILSVMSVVQSDRVKSSLDIGWKFDLDGGGGNLPPCAADSFPINLNGKQCLGLSQVKADTQDECERQCCAVTSCQTYQWCNTTDCMPSAQTACWIGSMKECHEGKGWISGGRNTPPPPPPSPGSQKCTVPQCMANFDDSKWRSVNVPHDFVVEGTFNETTGDKSHGYLPYGTGWYRKHLTIPADAKGKSLWIDFDGTMLDSQVWLNDVLLGGHASGYTPYRFYLNESIVKFGEENVLAVYLDATHPDGWWYDGGGIYRHVWLTYASKTHVRPWGVYVPALVTGSIDQTTGTADASVSPSVEVVNNNTAAATITVDVTLYATASNEKVGEGTASVTVPANSVGTATVPAITISKASLWSDKTPNLYYAKVAVMDGTTVLDTVQETFGVRKIEFSASKGLILNDIPTKIYGCANHQDFAGVGVAVPDVLQYHRIGKLKEMGANAWRTAHNVPTKALITAANELGFLVWDENHRNGQDSEVEILIRRDRNDPSVIIWSLCNEVLCNTADTKGDASRLKALMKSLDPHGQRPVSANNNGLNGAGTVLDLQGFDYNTQNYDKWHAAAPDVPAISSETSSAVSDRGEYTNDETTGHVSGYDVNRPGWGETAEVAWDGIEQRDFISGGFTWTGWDYKGEPTPYAWPDINSHFGILDVAGFPKDRFFWYQANYVKPNPPLVYVFPHWNWGNASHMAPCKGRCNVTADGAMEVDVWAYSNADDVELLVNGKSLGKVAAGVYSHAQWLKVPYVPGTLEARAYLNGSTTPASTATVATTGAPLSLRLSIKDKVGSDLKATGTDVALVMVEVVDDKGVVVPTADNVVTLAFTGPATYLGGGNGDPACHVNDKSLSRPAFHGLLLGVFQSTDTVGVISVTATSPGLQVGSVTIDSSAPSQPIDPRL